MSNFVQESLNTKEEYRSVVKWRIVFASNYYWHILLIKGADPKVAPVWKK